MVNMSMKEKKNTIFEEIKSLIFIVFVACLIRTLVFEPFYIPSSSMEPTLVEGDYVFSTKYDYGYSKYSLSPFSMDIFNGRILEKQASVGDIMIFRPPHRMDVRYIKRLIGLPGDKIQMVDGSLSINGKILQKDYVGEYVDANGTKFKRYKETLQNGLVHDIITLDHPANKNSEIFEVPQDTYFFMGDNRDNSLDSRFDLGYVPSENIISKAKLIHFSTDHPLWVENQDLADRFKQVWVWMSSVRFSRMFHSIYN